MRRKMLAMRLIRLLTIPVFIAALSAAAQPPSRWAQPAAALADQIAAILGPGQAHITLRNLSSIPADQLPAIQHLLEQDLKTHGIVSSGDDSASGLRITLSENARERLWIAEVVEGKETQVAMVRLDREPPHPAAPAVGLILRKQLIATVGEPLLGALETPGGLVTLGPEAVVIHTHTQQGWQQVNRISTSQRRPLPRDPRGLIGPTATGTGFEAWLAGTSCTGDYAIAPGAAGWEVHCRDSDDPWPILENHAAASVPALRAFYNAGRNYFTGVVTPNLTVDLPPFYSAALVPRPAGGAAMLVGGVDGKVQLVDNNTLKAVTGTRDWGSDFAALQSGCGLGTQIIASGSGEAAGDSLRAYELPALEAIPASAPLAMDGTVTALWPTPDNKSILAIVKSSTNQYEVDRVTALCN
jgi:hypothetical protein